MYRELEIQTRAYVCRKERVKKTDGQRPVRHDIAYGRLKLFSYTYLTKCYVKLSKNLHK